MDQSNPDQSSHINACLSKRWKLYLDTGTLGGNLKRSTKQSSNRGKIRDREDVITTVKHMLLSWFRVIKGIANAYNSSALNFAEYCSEHVILMKLGRVKVAYDPEAAYE
ncbi:hypothetical protein KQX54_001170 [Cotesia glomerata]|uniref:Uncharacterized protein n=1 Tax=Cotesia glomerata TaxID=32391 RepID=A0AAV7IH50_COTGL|nr:hypothetical protein KQX54_001170 [Cotesia glomerata]